GTGVKSGLSGTAIAIIVVAAVVVLRYHQRLSVNFTSCQDLDGSEGKPYTSIGEGVSKTFTQLGHVTTINVIPRKDSDKLKQYKERDIVIGDKLVEIIGLDGEFGPKSVIISAEEGGQYNGSVIAVTSGSLTLNNLLILALDQPTTEILITLNGVAGQISIINCTLEERSYLTTYTLPYIRGIYGRTIYIQSTLFKGGKFAHSALIETEERLSELVIENSKFQKQLFDAEDKGKGLALDAKVGPRGRLSVKGTKFTPDQSSNGQSNDEAEELCSWDSALIHVTGGTIQLSDSSLTGWSEGALLLEDGGSAVIDENVIFQANDPGFGSYQSIRRNIMCRGGGSISAETLDSFKKEDGSVSDSLWIYQGDSLSGDSEGECQLLGALKQHSSPHFIPILNDSIGSQDEADIEKGELKITFKGENLIPCGLLFEIYNRDNEKENYISAVTYSADSNEQQFSTVVQIERLPANSQLDARLRYGQSIVTAGFDVYVTGDLKKGTGVKSGLSGTVIAIIVVAAVVVLILIITLIVILASRLNKKDKDYIQGDDEVVTERKRVKLTPAETEIIDEDEDEEGNQDYSNGPDDQLSRSKIVDGTDIVTVQGSARTSESQTQSGGDQGSYSRAVGGGQTQYLVPHPDSSEPVADEDDSTTASHSSRGSKPTTSSTGKKGSDKESTSSDSTSGSSSSSSSQHTKHSSSSKASKSQKPKKSASKKSSKSGSRSSSASSKSTSSSSSSSSVSGSKASKSKSQSKKDSEGKSKTSDDSSSSDSSSGSSSSSDNNSANKSAAKTGSTSGTSSSSSSGSSSDSSGTASGSDKDKSNIKDTQSDSDSDSSSSSSSSSKSDE
ncbi:MAG: hypothetical protein EZS28_017160, partial [Streblomastix strix]